LIEVGQEVYYTGDMANTPGTFEVTGISGSGFYILKEIDGDREFTPFEIADEYDGTYYYRFVTTKAYEDYREQQASNLKRRFGS
jgi:hypothetical protein